jgi:hypothetical protein
MSVLMIKEQEILTCLVMRLGASLSKLYCASLSHELDTCGNPYF